MARRRPGASIVAVLLLLASAATAQPAGSLGNRDNGLNTRTLPGSTGTPPDATGRLQDRLPQRDLPTLQDQRRFAGVPEAQKERFAEYCRVRGCPGGYIQNQADFNAYEFERRLKQQDARERNFRRQRPPQ